MLVSHRGCWKMTLMINVFVSPDTVLWDRITIISSFRVLPKSREILYSFDVLQR